MATEEVAEKSPEGAVRATEEAMMAKAANLLSGRYTPLERAEH